MIEFMEMVREPSYRDNKESKENKEFTLYSPITDILLAFEGSAELVGTTVCKGPPLKGRKLALVLS